MADDVNEGIETALNMISITMEQSRNMKKQLKHTIYETVSTLKKLFVKLKDMNDIKTKTINELETLVATTKAETDGFRNRTARRHGAPSLTPRQELAWTADRGMVLPGMEQTKLYSEALGGKFKQKLFTLTVTSNESQPPDVLKGLLMSKINPTDIKVGINSLKILRDGRVQI